MKIKIKEGSIPIDELKLDLEEQFGDIYKIKKFSKNRITMAKGKITGAIVTLRKNEIIVVGNFPNPLFYGIFIFTMVLGGILIPFALYLIFFHKKMDQCGKEVGAFVRENYEKPTFASAKDYLGVDA